MALIENEVTQSRSEVELESRLLTLREKIKTILQEPTKENLKSLQSKLNNYDNLNFLLGIKADPNFSQMGIHLYQKTKRLDFIQKLFEDNMLNFIKIVDKDAYFLQERKNEETPDISFKLDKNQYFMECSMIAYSSIYKYVSEVLINKKGVIENYEDGTLCKKNQYLINYVSRFYPEFLDDNFKKMVVPFSSKNIQDIEEDKNQFVYAMRQKIIEKLNKNYFSNGSHGEGVLAISLAGGKQILSFSDLFLTSPEKVLTQVLSGVCKEIKLPKYLAAILIDISWYNWLPKEAGVNFEPGYNNEYGIIYFNHSSLPLCKNIPHRFSLGVIQE